MDAHQYIIGAKSSSALGVLQADEMRTLFLGGVKYAALPLQKVRLDFEIGQWHSDIPPDSSSV
jgi:hypothetical protein